MKKLILIIFFALCGAQFNASAQHTFGVVAGVGSGSERFVDDVVGKSIYGLYNAGVTWRYYSTSRFVGGVGVDLEFQQRGFSYVPFPSLYDDPSEYLYYRREINSIMMPIVWQPHFYIKKRVRVFFEAALTISYNMSSTYSNEYARSLGEPNWEGDYDFKLPRDNRWGYGLAGGGGIAVLMGRIEAQVRARYYFAYSDIVKNANKYSGNTIDGPENPFTYSPKQSPIDNLNLSLGLSYRFSADGYKIWSVKRVKIERAKTNFSSAGSSQGAGSSARP